jgi:hypothetical protein
MFEIPLSALFFMNSVTYWMQVYTLKNHSSPYLSNSSSYILEMPSKEQLEHPKRRLVIENEVKGEADGCIELISFSSAAFSSESLHGLYCCSDTGITYVTNDPKFCFVFCMYYVFCATSNFL